MKLALLGYGKMGRLVEDLAVRDGWGIGPKLDIEENAGGRGITRDAMAGVDVALEFSQPDAVMDNIRAAARVGLNLVVGTTGWYDGLAQAKKTVLDSGIGLVYASNFSVGVNLFFDIVSHAAQAVAKLPQYDPFLYEQHHRAKKDAPSGTAITLLELMKPFLKHKAEISSSRAGFIPGNHLVGFDSEADTIILEHRARSRQGFAEGALLAARWVIGKQGFYDFQKIFPDVLQMTNDE